MKLAVTFLLICILTEQINARNEGNATASNKTIASYDESPSFIKKLVNLFKKAAVNKTKTSTVNENSTIASSTEDTSIHNATQKPFTNSSTIVNLTTIINEQETDLNTTIVSENASIVNTTEYKDKITPTLRENTTTDVSPTYNTTQEPYVAISTLEKNLSSITTTSEISDLNTTSREDILLSNTAKDENNEITLRNNFTSTEEVETIVPELHTHSGTEKTYDVTISKLSTSDQQEGENYCKSYMEKLLLATFAEHANKLDPLIFEDKTISIGKPLLFDSIGEVGLYDGRAIGLSRAKPVEQCDIETRNDQIRLKSALSIGEIEIEYKGRALLLEFGTKITVYGKLSGSLVELQVDVPKDGGTGEIKRVRMQDIGKLKFDVKGLGPFKWALELITGEIIKAFSFDFRKTIERKLRNALEEEATKIKFP